MWIMWEHNAFPNRNFLLLYEDCPERVCGADSSVNANVYNLLF